ncbi:ribonuclease H family protein [Sporosarcina sp. FSL W7-1283]|uniref:ribonuclease H family protein n=1 Tax=Sporosarcina sp. FSL W7-1283 TaxID=2921560 RepID=UPI0030FB4692
MRGVSIYCDGGVRGNGKENNLGAWAYTVEIDRDLYSNSKVVINTTNNIMEMTACIEALKSLDDYDLQVTIQTDSSYLLQGATNWIINWKKNDWMRGVNKDQPVLNKELWQELDELCSKFAKVEWVKIKGHSGNHGNELVDAMVNKVMDEYLEKEGGLNVN